MLPLFINIYKHIITMKYPWIHCKYTNKIWKLLLPLIFWNFVTQKRQIWDKTEHLGQNASCSEQKISEGKKKMEDGTFRALLISQDITG